MIAPRGGCSIGASHHRDPRPGLPRPHGSAVPQVLRAAGLVVAALLLISCEASDLPSATPSRSPGSLPTGTATIPGPTRSPVRPESPTSTATIPGPTRSPTLPETPTPTLTDVPSPTVTVTANPPPNATVTASPPPSATVIATASPSLTPTPSPSPTTLSSATGSTATTTAAPSWLWWLLAALALAVVVTVPLIVRARRRRAWRAGLAAAEEEVAWFARVLVPDLRRASSVDQVAGGWAVASSRVAAVEDRLTALQPSAPDDSGRIRVRTLRDAVRTSRGHMQDVVDSGAPGTVHQDLDAVVAELEAALRGAANPSR